MKLDIQDYMTSRNEFQKRMLPVDLILLAGLGLLLLGGMAFTIYALSAGSNINTLTILAGILVVLGGLVLMWALVVWVMQRGSHRMLTGYGCRRCGYVPRVSDIQGSRPHPCQICGQPQYDAA